MSTVTARERPWLVTIAGALFVFLGIQGLREGILNLGLHHEAYTLSWNSDLIVVAPAIAKALFIVAAGIGVLIGTRWGWWLLVVSLFGGLVYDLCIFAMLMAHDGEVSDYVFLELFKRAAGIFLRPLFLLYCLKDRVLRFFGLRRKSISYMLPVFAVTAVFISLYLIYVYMVYITPERLFIF